MDDFKNEISSPRRGMSKGVDPRNLEPNDYAHALNASISNDDGDFYDLTYEKSNVKEVEFPSGYKVISRFNRLLKNWTYYFLHNPETRYNLFGYVDNSVMYDDTLSSEDLPQPLEEQNQTPYRHFTVLIDDSCFSTPEEGFNFHIDSPIQNVVVKEQKTGGVAFFTDARNKPRYIELDNIEKYFTQEEPCDSDIVTDCPLMYKMLLHKEYELPVIEEVGVANGGALEKGVYSILISLTDSLGNEISEYFSQTQLVDVFSQGEGTTSDKAIRVKIGKLDPLYTHYKVVVIHTGKESGATTYYDAGVYSTNNRDIVISDISTYQRTSLEKISFVNQRVLRSEGFTTANNSLLEYGLVFERELNLQPIANLLGSFLQWQTHVAKENLYSFGDMRAKYLGINRNEVVPYGIRFMRTGGTTTPVFPLVGREPKTSDLQVVPTSDINRESIEVSETCVDTIRDKRWQFFDTSSVTDTWGENTTTVVSTYIDTCIVNAAVESPAESIEIAEEDTAIISVENYIEENLQNCTGYLQGTELCDVYNGDYSNIVCSVNSESNCTSEVLEQELRIAEIVNPSIRRNLIDEFGYYTFFSTADTPLENDTYLRDSSQQLIQDTSVTNYTLYRRVLNTNTMSRSRQELSSNTVSNPIAPATVADNNFRINSSPYKVFLCEDVEQQLTTYNSPNNLMGGLFKEQVNKNAQWFNFNWQGTLSYPPNVNVGDGISVSIQPTKEYTGALPTPIDEDFPINPTYRVSIFGAVTSSNTYSNAIHSFTYNSNIGAKFMLYRTGDEEITIQVGNSGGSSTTTVISDIIISEIHFSIEQVITELDAEEETCIIHPTNGSYVVSTEMMELGFREMSWDKVVFDVVNTVEVTCTTEDVTIGNCTAVPYQKGEFGYHEQETNYPDNPELYDSSNLVLDLELFPNDIQAEVQEKVAGNPTQGGYRVRDSFDLTCKPIRHFKFPSNKTSPFMSHNTEHRPNGVEGYIYPLGVTIDERVVNSFLDVAVGNNLITQEERDTIYGYEIFRGDLSVNRSVVASGLLYDMRTYTERDKAVNYPNYPFNSRGADLLNKQPANTSNKDLGSRFTFHSPELDYYFGDNSASEMNIEGYQYGAMFGRFNEVEGHPKWTVLNNNANNLASTLATLEIVAEAAIASAEAFASSDAMWIVGGMGSSGSNAGLAIAKDIVAQVALPALMALGESLFKYARYKQQWLDFFENLSPSSNLANYFYSHGYYNNLKAHYTDTNRVRGLQANKAVKDGRVIVTNNITKDKIEINNVDREWSTVIDLGEDYNIQYPAPYLNHENGSITYQSVEHIATTGVSPEVVKGISSPYVQLVNYNPNQHGGISSISWLTTSYKGDLRDPKPSWLPIFGGDTFITRHTLKRKMPLFTTTAMGQSPTTAFKYSFYNNIGTDPLFFVDYKVENDYTSNGFRIPTIGSRYNVDNRSDAKYVLKEPSKFYLYYYGIPDFLCETRINTNYREAGREPRQNFYPNVGDIGRWTQESFVKLREPNYFDYSRTYSRQVTPFNSRTLSESYKRENQEIRENSVNGVIFSLPDYDENSQTDPWLKFLPLDYYEFDTRYGRLKELKGIEGEAILARFEHTAIIYNKVDSKIDDGQSPSTYLGGRSIFQRRTASFVNAEIGYGGTNHKESLSCEYGHFYADNSRGQLLQIPTGGGSMSEISYINTRGEITGMKEWFKRHLPFKIKNYNIEGVEHLNTDNAYNGIGMTFGWDSMNKRVLITKRDYVPKSSDIKYEKGVGFTLNSTGVEVDLKDERYFEDVSWTVGYYPSLGKFSSFYSYTPDFYVDHFNYYTAGKNADSSLWTHNVTNKSAGVFFGTKYPMEVEVITKSSIGSYIGSVGLLTEAKRYYNNEDYSVNQELTFNKSIIYNRRECSGNLVLDLVKGGTRYLSRYPLSVDSKTQRIPLTRTESMFNYNYFYNRVDKTQQTPIIKSDKNEMTIEVDNVNFNIRGQLERLNGDYYLNRLIYDTDSRYLLTIKLNKSLTNLDRM